MERLSLQDESFRCVRVPEASALLKRPPLPRGRDHRGQNVCHPERKGRAGNQVRQLPSGLPTRALYLRNKHQVTLKLVCP